MTPHRHARNSAPRTRLCDVLATGTCRIDCDAAVTSVGVGGTMPGGETSGCLGRNMLISVNYYQSNMFIIRA